MCWFQTAQKLTQEGDLEERKKKLRMTVNQLYRFCSGGSATAKDEEDEDEEEKSTLAKCFDYITCRAIFEK